VGGDVAPRVAVVSCATGVEFLDWTREWLAAMRHDTDYAGPWSIDLVDDGGELVGLTESDVGPGTRVSAHAKFGTISEVFNCALEHGLERDPDFVCLVTTSTRPGNREWLSVLVNGLLEHEDVGIAGSLNLNADGTLNHAGMALLRAGALLFTGHVGRDVERGGELEFVERNVEAVTGACFLIRRQILDFGIRFDPLYRQGFNDTDFCLQVRETGYGIRYFPAARMVRWEGHTRDSPRFKTDPSVDWRAFNEKWKGRSAAW
jgi:hypothetical protein